MQSMAKPCGRSCAIVDLLICRSCGKSQYDSIDQMVKDINAKMDDFWFIARIIILLSLRLLFRLFWTLIGKKRFRFIWRFPVRGNFVRIPSPFVMPIRFRSYSTDRELTASHTANPASSPLPHPPCNMISSLAVRASQNSNNHHHLI